jgi:alanyl-tRNA synthetase
MKQNEIRQSFLDFFSRYSHKPVVSAPVVPQGDPTLLFTNAGMNQFKDIFLGFKIPDVRRICNSQKCIRVSGKHNDLEEVGIDTYHHTFFEMLGNWSFGDYYKEEAITMAWELLTAVWKLPTEKLYATVYRSDDEAEKIWLQKIGLPPERVMRFDEKDNFWEMGETGPCGPCSEIHIDLGTDACDRKNVSGHTCRVNGDCARYIEIWNLVFIQFNRAPDGTLNELSEKHIDTGMGFERVSCILQNKTSNYDTEILLNRIESLCGLLQITCVQSVFHLLTELFLQTKDAVMLYAEYFAAHSAMDVNWDLRSLFFMTCIPC